MARLVAVILTTLLVVSVASPVHAQCGGTGPACIQDLETVIKNIIELLTPAAAIAFLAMIIVGAFKFITSGGDQKGTAGARSTLTYAMIGVLLVASSILILRVINELTGANVTTVTIPAAP